MRLRKKWWAEEALEQSGLVFLDPKGLSGHWQEQFACPQDLYLELGCGRGRFIRAMAARYSERNFVGMDLEMNALVEALRNPREEERKNLRYLVHNIQSVEDCFEKDEVQGIYIHFCNPWPKKSQNKRRLTHPRQLAQYAQFLQKGGWIDFKTDDPGLYKDSLDYFSSCGFEILSMSKQLAWEDDPEGILSAYEERWRKCGKPIHYIRAYLKDPEKAQKYLPVQKNQNQEIYLKRKQDREG